MAARGGKGEKSRHEEKGGEKRGETGAPRKFWADRVASLVPRGILYCSFLFLIISCYFRCRNHVLILNSRTTEMDNSFFF